MPHQSRLMRTVPLPGNPGKMLHRGLWENGRQKEKHTLALKGRTGGQWLKQLPRHPHVPLARPQGPTCLPSSPIMRPLAVPRRLGAPLWKVMDVRAIFCRGGFCPANLVYAFLGKVSKCPNQIKSWGPSWPTYSIDKEGFPSHD